MRKVTIITILVDCSVSILTWGDCFVACIVAICCYLLTFNDETGMTHQFQVALGSLMWWNASPPCNQRLAAESRKGRFVLGHPNGQEHWRSRILVDDFCIFLLVITTPPNLKNMIIVHFMGAAAQSCDLVTWWWFFSGKVSIWDGQVLEVGLFNRILFNFKVIWLVKPIDVPIMSQVFELQFHFSRCQK